MYVREERGGNGREALAQRRDRRRRSAIGASLAAQLDQEVRAGCTNVAPREPVDQVAREDVLTRGRDRAVAELAVGQPGGTHRNGRGRTEDERRFARGLEVVGPGHIAVRVAEEPVLAVLQQPEEHVSRLAAPSSSNLQLHHVAEPELAPPRPGERVEQADEGVLDREPPVPERGVARRGIRHRGKIRVVTSPGSLALATRGLRKSYGKRLALDGLDLSVPAGVVYGFLGPNGAGKTTTMRLLTGLLHPDAGTIDLLGRPFRRGDRQRLFEVGALVENPSAYPYLSGRRNLEVLAATGAHVPAKRIEELLELVGLRERARDKVSGYSLGMRQRLGIAGALLSDPKLLLLDEPANGLDPAGIVAMRELLRRLAASGKTVFVSSHLLAEVRVLADVVGIIAAGKLVREGTLESLLEDQGVVRVRVPRADEAAARGILERIARTDGGADATDEDPWLAVHVEPARAGEVNRALAEARIYATGLESGTDLELLFLELTGGTSASNEGTFGAAGVAGAAPGTGTTPSGGSGKP